MRVAVACVARRVNIRGEVGRDGECRTTGGVCGLDLVFGPGPSLLIVVILERNLALGCTAALHADRDLAVLRALVHVDDDVLVELVHAVVTDADDAEGLFRCRFYGC